eukprot:TRINITY_DN882_c0_g1_i2.p1 TRINITY_DN882_c0_g1~~TRINITY_DN882_c0_g1_i2.p1  ORF type:complete len:345 (-),score=67.95 TRINITY_DN882_c0_g1_i2:94-1128(-)
MVNLLAVAAALLVLAGSARAAAAANGGLSLLSNSTQYNYTCGARTTEPLNWGDVRTYDEEIGSEFSNGTRCDPVAHLGLWFSFLPTIAGTLSLDPNGCDSPVLLEILTGECGDELCVGTYDEVVIDAAAGTTYNVFLRPYQDTVPPDYTYLLRASLEPGASVSSDLPDPMCPQYTRAYRGDTLNSGFLSSPADSVSAGCWSGPALGEFWDIEVFSDVFLCADHPINVSIVSDLCQNASPTCARRFTAEARDCDWCDHFSCQVPVGQVDERNHLLVSSTYNGVSYDMALNTTFFRGDSSSDAFNPLWWIVLPVLCGVLVLCVVAACVFGVWWHRRHANYVGLPAN